MLEKWYGLFPENPYARISALLPLTVLFALIIIPALNQYIYGYRYNPSVTDAFSDNLAIVKKNLTDEKLLVYDHADFYRILEKTMDIKVIDKFEKSDKLAVMGQLGDTDENYQLSRIITSPKRDNSDIIYLYIYSEEKEGE